MSADMEWSMEEATAELRRQQERLKEIRGQLRTERTKVTSKDGMVTVTLDGKGEVGSIAFNTAKFRKMAPMELGAALVETISRARAETRARIAGAYKSFMPDGMNIDDILGGKTDINRMFDDAVREAGKLMSDGRTGATPARSASTRDGGHHG